MLRRQRTVGIKNAEPDRPRFKSRPGSANCGLGQMTLLPHCPHLKMGTQQQKLPNWPPSNRVSGLTNTSLPLEGRLASLCHCILGAPGRPATAGASTFLLLAQGGLSPDRSLPAVIPTPLGLE